MAFVPRGYQQIRDDMLAFIRMQTELTDFEIGSVIRTIVEAAALEDDEQYFQMVQLLDAFRLSSASGQDLNDRVEEFGLIRLQPASSSGTIVITDGTLVTDTLAFNSPAGSATVTLDDSTDFPTTPFVLRIGEGTVVVEDVSIASNNTGTGVLTLVGLTANAHDAGERASVVSGAADKLLSSGIRVQVPATGDEEAITFVTVEEGTLVNGNFDSTSIRTRAEVPGSVGNIGVGKIEEFISSPPFDGASVTNRVNFGGGRDLETDAQLRDRARSAIQSLSRGTVLALKEGVIGVADEVTGQSVTTSNLLESFVTNEVTVFIDDGTGFVPDQVQLARTELAVATLIGATMFTVVDATDFPEEGTLIVSTEDPGQIEILDFSGVNYTTNIISLVSPTTAVHDIADEVSVVDLIEDDSEAGRNFFQTSNFPIVENSQRIWLDSGGGGSPVLQAENTDYNFNRGTGQIEFIGAGVAQDSIIVAHYNYYTGLLATVQKVIDGDPDDPVNFPGIRAAGIRVFAETPIIRRITVRASIVAIPGIQENDLIPLVQEALESYINGLGIGEDVIVAELIERAMRVDGMLDVTISLPTGNVVILENELPRAFDTNGNSLVDVA